ncbi:hypothetical protein CBOM_06030 [Ceraceosorus bombacis]|uniref:Uncharacterized protein n=1 Tax=Ceraceosorus bombacis TaxID=401625 RepID=A0A0P1BII8_9BASI|nr:hypothetical protein CBOM_06030 [Ceraceosorus bombacis]
MTSSSSVMSGSTHPQAASSSGPSASAPMAMSAPKATSSHVMSAPELAAQGLLFRKPRNQPSALPSAAGALPYEGSAPPPPPAHSQPYHQPTKATGVEAEAVQEARIQKTALRIATCFQNPLRGTNMGLPRGPLPFAAALR